MMLDDQFRAVPIQTVAPDLEEPVLDEEAAAEELKERLQELVGKLEQEAARRVQKRYPIEQRWLMDLRQYHGIYEPEDLKRMDEAEGSQVFINLTATKTDALEARLWDLLFPTDDKNWGIGPTPVPELTEQAEQAMAALDKAKETADTALQEGLQAKAEGDMEAVAAAEERMRMAEADEAEAQSAKDQLQAILEEAKRRAHLMQEEIDDQLVESNYQAHARDVIGDACKIGTGVIKGPFRNERVQTRWTQDETGQHVLQHHQGDAPAAMRCDPWGFFPDMDVRRIEDSDGVYERHIMSKKLLRRLAQKEGYDKSAIRELLREGPHLGNIPTYMTELHSLTGESSGDFKDAYAVWEYTGAIDAEDMATLERHFSVPTAYGEETDPLEEIQARVVFCQGRVLFFSVHPLDSQEVLYSVYTIRTSESSIFGYGIPWVMRHPQSVLNGAYRMMMDNSGLSTGPQVLVNKDAVVPEDGNWTLRPRKVWLLQTTALAASAVPFSTFNIPSNQQEIANIIDIAGRTIDEVTAMPAMAQGEQGSGVTKTAQGMALLMNSANVSFRRIVKNFDDDITTPMIRRFYHWNMQFSQKEHIKGDYEVNARGSGVLLVREMQAVNLMSIAQVFGDHPTYAPMIKHPDLFRAIIRSHMIPADEIVKSDRDYKAEMEQQQQQEDPAAMAALMREQNAAEMIKLEREKLQAQVEMHNQEWATREKLAQWEHEARMVATAENLNMNADQLAQKAASDDRKDRAADRRLAVEAAMKQRTGDSAGGSI